MHSIFWFRTRQWVLSRVLHLTEHKKQTLLAAPAAPRVIPETPDLPDSPGDYPRLCPPRNTDVSAGWL